MTAVGNPRFAVPTFRPERKRKKKDEKNAMEHVAVSDEGGGVSSHLEGLDVGGDELTLIVQHLLEVRHVPARVCGIPMSLDPVCAKHRQDARRGKKWDTSSNR